MAADPGPRRGRRWPWIVGALGAVLLLCWWSLTGSPLYSLARFASAIQSHDAQGALRYVDVDRAADAATEVVVADYFARQRRPSNVIEALGQGMARQAALQTARPQVAARIRSEIGRMADESGGGLPAGLMAVLRGVEIRRAGDQAVVTYADPRQGTSRFRMTRQPDRSWKITELDPEWIRRRMHERAPSRWPGSAP